MANILFPDFLKKEEAVRVLRGLYSHAKPKGMGFLAFVRGDLPKEEAESLLGERGAFFDYLHGRIMKIDLRASNLFQHQKGRETFPIPDFSLYDRENGEGEGYLAAIDGLTNPKFNI